MQKKPTANERQSNSFACNNQTHTAIKQSTTLPTTSTHTVNSTEPTSSFDRPTSPSLTVNPALASLVVTDSPRSSSSNVSFTCQSQPSSPASPALLNDCVVSAERSSDSVSGICPVPVTAAGSGGVVTSSSVTARVRVPLSQVVTSLTHRWSMEYLAEAEAGDVDAQCLVAQMFLTGWGALKEDQAEGKRWLQRAKESGIAGTVNKLELLYLGGDCDSSGGGTSIRRTSDETCGYYSGYANTPHQQSSPSASASTSLASFMPSPTPSFFATVAATISPKPVVVAPVGRAVSPNVTSGAGRLSVPNERMTAMGGMGSGSSGASSGDEHSHSLQSIHHASHHHHPYHWHMHAREQSSELGVSAS